MVVLGVAAFAAEPTTSCARWQAAHVFDSLFARANLTRATGRPDVCYASALASCRDQRTAHQNRARPTTPSVMFTGVATRGAGRAPDPDRSTKKTCKRCGKEGHERASSLDCPFNAKNIQAAQLANTAVQQAETSTLQARVAEALRSDAADIAAVAPPDLANPALFGTRLDPEPRANMVPTAHEMSPRLLLRSLQTKHDAASQLPVRPQPRPRSLQRSHHNYCAVRNGRNGSCTHTSWPECERDVHGFSHAEFKGFATLAEANAFIGRGDVDDVTHAPLSPAEGAPVHPVGAPAHNRRRGTIMERAAAIRTALGFPSTCAMPDIVAAASQAHAMQFDSQPMTALNAVYDITFPKSAPLTTAPAPNTASGGDVSDGFASSFWSTSTPVQPRQRSTPAPVDHTIGAAARADPLIFIAKKLDTLAAALTGPEPHRGTGEPRRVVTESVELDFDDPGCISPELDVSLSTATEPAPPRPVTVSNMKSVPKVPDSILAWPKYQQRLTAFANMHYGHVGGLLFPSADKVTVTARDVFAVERAIALIELSANGTTAQRITDAQDGVDISPARLMLRVKAHVRKTNASPVASLERRLLQLKCPAGHTRVGMVSKLATEMDALIRDCRKAGLNMGSDHFCSKLQMIMRRSHSELCALDDSAITDYDAMFSKCDARAMVRDDQEADKNTHAHVTETTAWVCGVKGCANPKHHDDDKHYFDCAKCKGKHVKGPCDTAEGFKARPVPAPRSQRRGQKQNQHHRALVGANKEVARLKAALAAQTVAATARTVDVPAPDKPPPSLAGFDD